MPIRLGKKCLSKDTKEMSTLKFFLVCVYVLSPFVDMYNGYVQQFFDSRTIVPVIFKMMIILFSFRYILRTNKETILLRVFSPLLLFCYFSPLSIFRTFTIVVLLSLLGVLLLCG